MDFICSIFFFIRYFRELKKTKFSKEAEKIFIMLIERDLPESTDMTFSGDYKIKSTNYRFSKATTKNALYTINDRRAGMLVSYRFNRYMKNKQAQEYEDKMAKVREEIFKANTSGINELLRDERIV